MDGEEIGLQQHEHRSQRRFEELAGMIRRLEEELRQVAGSTQAGRGGSRQEGWTEPMTARQHEGRMVIMELDERLRRLEHCVHRLEQHMRQFEQAGHRAFHEGIYEGEQRGRSRGYAEGVYEGEQRSRGAGGGGQGGGGSSGGQGGSQRARELPYDTGGRDIPRQMAFEIGYMPHYGYGQGHLPPVIGYFPL